MKALITGVTGFVGKYLTRLLIAEGIEVWGCTLTDVEQLDVETSARVKLMSCDIRDPLQTRQLLSTSLPDFVFHLAAQSNVARSWVNIKDTFDNNLTGTINLLDSIIESGCNPKVLITGSGEEYGKVSTEEMPLGENTALNPQSPYGASKAAVSLLFKQYFTKHGLRVIYTRSFNHIGPGQSPGFVTIDFAKQIAEIEAGLRKPVIKVGNLEARRDFTDVRDIVQAYWVLMQKGEPGEIYNVASGSSITIEEILRKLLELSSVEIKIQRAPEKMRPSDLPVLAGNMSKIKGISGWEPQISLMQSLKDILEYARREVGVGS